MSATLFQKFHDKVVLVTGSSSGIGAAAAIQFAAHGASVIITGRNLERLKNVEEKCTFENQPKPLAIVGDVTKDEDIENIIAKTIEHFHKLDILVNNAGGIEFDSIENTNVELFDRIMNTNFRSVYQLTRLAVPHLIATKGNIINISSLSAIRTYAVILSYATSKAALEHFTKNLSLSLGPKHVRVNNIIPGIILTNIMDEMKKDEEKFKKFIEHQSNITPLGRIGQPDDIANAILFLASDKASFITGATLVIDGGLQHSHA